MTDSDIVLHYSCEDAMDMKKTAGIQTPLSLNLDFRTILIKFDQCVHSILSRNVLNDFQDALTSGTKDESTG